MTSNIIAYNFIAALLKWHTKSIENFNSVELKSRLPKFRGAAYCIDSHSILFEYYSFLSDTYWVKVKNGAVSEIYLANSPIKPTASFVTIDIATLKPIEYYKNTGQKEQKFDFYTDKFMQTNYFVKSFFDLPLEYQEKLQAFDKKDFIYSYAEKPYGKIVEVSTL